MFVVCENTELFELLTCKPALWKHSCNGISKDIIRLTSLHDTVRNFSQPTWVLCMVSINFLSLFCPCHFNLAGVDDDNSISTIDVGSKCHLVLSTQDFSDMRSKSPEGFPSGVQDEPLAIVCCLFFRQKARLIFIFHELPQIMDAVYDVPHFLPIFLWGRFRSCPKTHGIGCLKYLFARLSPELDTFFSFQIETSKVK